MPIYKTDIRKDGKQQYRVRVNYTTNDGKHKQIERTAYGLAEAKDIETKLLNEYVGTTSGNTKMTVRELYDEYIEVKKYEVRQSTFEKSNRELRMYVLPYLGNERIDKLNSKILQQWKIEIDKKPLSITTKKNKYKTLRALLNYAVKMEYLSKNPLLTVGNFKDVYFKPTDEKIHYYTEAQFTKYIKAAEEYASSHDTLTEWGYYVFFYIAYFTGMRKGEINALKWSDIDDNIIHIRRSVSQKTKGNSILETPPKNKSSMRDLQMPLPLKSVLEKHKSRQMQTEDFNINYRVCGGIKCLSDTAIDMHNRIYSKNAGIDRIRVHDFRHSHASLLCNEGINIQEIARRLGHSDIQTTWNTYAHLYPREEERAIAILNKIKI